MTKHQVHSFHEDNRDTPGKNAKAVAICFATNFLAG